MEIAIYLYPRVLVKLREKICKALSPVPGVHLVLGNCTVLVSFCGGRVSSTLGGTGSICLGGPGGILSGAVELAKARQ